MTETPHATPATAGFSLLAAIVLCAVIGFALGSLFGLAVLTGLVGGFIGIGVGFAIVYHRFKGL